MSGMTFPNEADLFEFSDSSESPRDNLKHDVDLDDKPAALAKTNKSDPNEKSKVEPEILLSATKSHDKLP